MQTPQTSQTSQTPQTPKVSVIIPAYNIMRYLPATLDSVLQQTFRDYEILIVNDGSTDSLVSWVEHLQAQLQAPAPAPAQPPEIRLISQPNQGLATARNTGIRHAQGEYLAFLDGDDLWLPTKLEQQVEVLERHPQVGLVYTWVAYINEQDEFTGRVFQHQAEGDVWRELTQHNLVECGSVPLIRRACLDQVGWFDQRFSSFNMNEDWDMWLRIASRYPFKVIKAPLVYYRQHSNSASKNWQVVQKSFEIVIEKAFADASPDLLELKQQSYASANLCLAWKAIQSRDRNYQQAIEFRRAALTHAPNLRFSKEVMRLSVAIALLQALGPEGYQRFLGFFYPLRHSVQTLGHRLALKKLE